MCDTIDEEITADIVASQIVFERDAHTGAILVVEGDTDSLFFKRIVDNSECKIIVAHGKDNALDAIKLLTPDSVCGVLCVVDADFHHLNVKQVAIDGNTVITDYHDIEVMLFESPSLEKLVDEYGSKDKVSKLQSSGKDIRDIVYNSAIFVGAFRLWSTENNFNLTFKKIKNGDYSFVSTSDLLCDLSSLVSSVKNASRFFDKNDSMISDELRDIAQKGYDNRQICCGHDVCGILSRAFSKLIASKGKNTLTKESIEKNLRLGYESQYFLSTNLYEAIILWERNNTNFKILP